MSEMTDERAAEVLAAHNEWRRHNGETGEPGAPEMGDPAETGRAIDHAVSRLRSQPPAEAQRCTCPSGDGSLRWPCPAHPPEAQVWCPSCDGAGWAPDAMDGSARAVCPDCAGSGRGEHSITVNEAQADWEAAPPGATHYQPHQDAYYKRVSASEWYVWSREDDRELMRWLPSLGTRDNAEWVVRPVEAPPSTPVGVEE